MVRSAVSRPGVAEPIGEPPAPAGTSGEAATLRWLSACGLPAVSHRLASSRDEALNAATSFGYPVVLKIADGAVLHKTDVGGVRAGLLGPDDVAASFADLMRAQESARGGEPAAGVVVEPQLSGIEVLLGVRRDHSLGPFVVFGSGGVLAELVADAGVAAAPLSPTDAGELIRSARIGRLLDGYRGRAGVDVGALDALAAFIVALSDLAVRHPELTELDLNPVMVGSGAAIAVDGRMVAGEPEPAAAAAAGRPLPGTLFEPRSIAVIGASRDPGKPGGRVLRYLLSHGYQGRIYPVNPNAAAVQGIEAVRSLSDLARGAVDLACVAVPAQDVAPALRQCAGAGVTAAVVYSAGFAEAGPAGKEREEELGRIVSASPSGMRCVGPNSNGLVTIEPPVFSAIGMVLEIDPAPPGPVALLTQSGAIGSSLLSRGWDEELGFSRWISTGNEADIALGEFVGYLADDPQTQVVLAFIEGIRDGAAFARAVGRCRANGKPVVAYKAGNSPAGQQAAVSHTGALAGDDRLYDAYFSAAGVIRVRSLYGLLDAGRALARYPVPGGGRAGLIAMSGGAAAILADECAAAGLEVPPLPSQTRRHVAAILPGFGSAGNPLDVTAEAITDPAVLLRCVVALVDCDVLDVVLVQLTTNAEPAASAIASGIADIVRTSVKPVLVGRLGSPRLAPAGLATYRMARIPVFDTPERLVEAARVLARHGELSRRQPADDEGV
jgi:acetate---CoA ligase (ADP-forming)